MPRLCPGCRSLEGEHNFGSTCTLTEDWAERGAAFLASLPTGAVVAIYGPELPIKPEFSKADAAGGVDVVAFTIRRDEP